MASDGMVSFVAAIYGDPDSVSDITQTFAIGFNAGDGQRFSSFGGALDEFTVFRVDGIRCHFNFCIGHLFLIHR